MTIPCRGTDVIYVPHTYARWHRGRRTGCRSIFTPRVGWARSSSERKRSSQSRRETSSEYRSRTARSGEAPLAAGPRPTTAHAPSAPPGVTEPTVTQTDGKEPTNPRRSASPATLPALRTPGHPSRFRLLDAGPAAAVRTARPRHDGSRAGGGLAAAHPHSGDRSAPVAAARFASTSERQQNVLGNHASAPASSPPSSLSTCCHSVRTPAGPPMGDGGGEAWAQGSSPGKVNFREGTSCESSRVGASIAPRTSL